MKFLGTLYLLWVVATAALGALVTSGLVCKLAAGTTHGWHSLVAAVLHVAIFTVLFLHGLVLHLRVPSSAVISLGVLFVIGIMAAALHFLG